MSLRLKAALRGNLKKFMEQEIKVGKRAVKQSVSEVTTDLKLTMRQQVTSAGLSTRLANTWRGDVYPKGQTSLRSAGVVYTRAQAIMQSFEYALAIRGKEKRFLAIPTPSAPKRGTDGKRIQPSNFPSQKFGKLRYVARPGKPALLVADNARASFSRKTGELRGFQPASKTARRTGRGLTTVVMFILVPQVQMPKLIRFFNEANRAITRLPDEILKRWPD